LSVKNKKATNNNKNGTFFVIFALVKNKQVGNKKIATPSFGAFFLYFSLDLVSTYLYMAVKPGKRVYL